MANMELVKAELTEGKLSETRKIVRSVIEEEKGEVDRVAGNPNCQDSIAPILPP